MIKGPKLYGLLFNETYINALTINMREKNGLQFKKIDGPYIEEFMCSRKRKGVFIMRNPRELYSSLVLDPYNV